MSESLLLTVHSTAETVVWVLIHSLWLGVLVAAITAALLAGARRVRPQIRYLSTCIALGLILPLSILTVTYHSPNQGHATATQNTTQVIGAETPSLTETADSEGSDVVFYTTTGLDLLKQSTPGSWIFLAWLMGVAWLSLYHVFGWRHANRLVRLGSQPVPGKWLATLTHLSNRLGVRQRVTLMQSPFLKTPCVVGWIKPAVLLPVTVFTNLSATDLQMILAHELAHIRRHDVLINYLQTAIETLLFFNPAVWFISKQIRMEREHICDDLAVDTCGDRVAYARALANLEALRSPRPHLAPAADGTSLLHRVRRLAGVPDVRSRWQSFSLISTAAVVTVLALTISMTTALVPAKVNAQADNVYQRQSGDIDGDWELEQSDDSDRPTLTLRFTRRGQTSFPVDLNKLQGLTDGDNVQFRLVRDAGTFYFEGDVSRDKDGLWGDGECHFRPDPDYVDQMEKLGYRIRSDNKLVSMALIDVDLAFARGLAELGYDYLSLDQLIAMYIHGASPEFIKDLDRLGYKDLDSDRLVEMRIHGVTPEYIEQLGKFGHRNIAPSKLVEMRIHRVDPDYIRRFSEIGYDNINPSKLVEMSIHGVSPEYVAELGGLGYKNLDPSTLVQMRIHRVDLEVIRALSELGYSHLSPSKLVEMQIHRVDPYFIKGLAELGYDDVDPSDLVAMRIHDVTPDFIRKMQERGYKNLSPDRLIEYKIHGYGDRYRRGEDRD
ncbi:MAG: M56 family metallopeptidase [Candidatus Zixiibacteriota bacterium]